MSEERAVYETWQRAEIKTPDDMMQVWTALRAQKHRVWFYYSEGALVCAIVTPFPRAYFKGRDEVPLRAFELAYQQWEARKK